MATNQPTNQLELSRKNYLQVIKDITADLISLMAPNEQQRFIAIATERFRIQPELGECTPVSVYSALKELAFSKVEPKPEHAFLNIRVNKKTKEKECHLQWQSEGKKRAINVATDGKYYVLADVIRQNDTYKVGGFPRKLRDHSWDDLSNRGDVIGAYAVLMRVGDDYQAQMVEMSREDIEHVRDTYSDSYKGGATNWVNGQPIKNPEDKSTTTWAKEFSEMCIKTVIGRLHKRVKSNIDSYTQDETAPVLDRAYSQVTSSNPFDAIDVVSNPSIANTPDEAQEIDINNDEGALNDLDNQDDGGLLPDSKPITNI